MCILSPYMFPLSFFRFPISIRCAWVCLQSPYRVCMYVCKYVCVSPHPVCVCVYIPSPHLVCVCVSVHPLIRRVCVDAVECVWVRVWVCAEGEESAERPVRGTRLGQRPEHRGTHTVVKRRKATLTCGTMRVRQEEKVVKRKKSFFLFVSLLGHSYEESKEENYRIYKYKYKYNKNKI